MSVDVVYKYNQTGYCRFQQNCRNSHIDETCSEENNCKSNGCLKRHSKIWRVFNKEETCKFRIDCAYRHKQEITSRINVQDIQIKHTKKVFDLKEEVEKLKEIVSQMDLENEILTKRCQKKNETKVEEKIKILVNMLNNQKNQETSFKSSKKDENLVHCDLCVFNCEKENDMIHRITDWHNDCPSFDLCRKYFGTKLLLKKHKKETDDNKDSMTESECEEIVEKKSKKNKKSLRK